MNWINKTGNYSFIVFHWFDRKNFYSHCNYAVAKTGKAFY